MTRRLSTPRVCFLIVAVCGVGLTVRLGWVGLDNVRHGQRLERTLGPEIPDFPAGRVTTLPATWPVGLSPEDLARAEAAGQKMIADLRRQRQEQLLEVYDHIRRGAFLLALSIVLTVIWVLVALRIWQRQWKDEDSVAAG